MAGLRDHHVAPPAYGWAKRLAEEIAAVHAEIFGFDLTVIRPSAVYGPGQDPRTGLGAITIFADKVLRGEPLRVFGSLRSSRDYVHVRDVARAVERAMTCDVHGTFDLGGPEQISLNTLIALIGGATGLVPTVQVEAATGVDPDRVALDSSAFREATGWSPEIRVADSLHELVTGLRSHLGTVR